MDDYDHNQRRDLFAAAAPAEVPEWFKCPLPDVPAAVFPDDLSRRAGEYCTNSEEIDAGRRLQKEVRFFSWRRFFADRMIEELDGGRGGDK